MAGDGARSLLLVRWSWLRGHARREKTCLVLERRTEIGIRSSRFLHNKIHQVVSQRLSSLENPPRPMIHRIGDPHRRHDALDYEANRSFLIRWSLAHTADPEVRLSRSLDIIQSPSPESRIG